MPVIQGLVAAALVGAVASTTRNEAIATAVNPTKSASKTSASDEAGAMHAEMSARDADDHAAWQAQVAEAGQSWQNEYCRWAWHTICSCFQLETADPDEIARGDGRDVTVNYYDSRREFHGGCRLTGNGRAIPACASQIDPSRVDSLDDQLAADERSEPPQYRKTAGHLS